MPLAPSTFNNSDIAFPSVIWLSHLNEEERDRRLAFVTKMHTYFIDGAPTLGSVTNLIHIFCEEFDEYRIIEKMLAGHPRFDAIDQNCAMQRTMPRVVR